MLISRTAHDLIVEEIRNQTDLVVAELRNQIANLTSERDFYRRNWTKSRGQTFTKPGEAEQSLPLFDPPTPAPLDADWTHDERMLFKDWARDLPQHVNPEAEWESLYGRSSPLLVLTE